MKETPKHFPYILSCLGGLERTWLYDTLYNIRWNADAKTAERHVFLILENPVNYTFFFLRISNKTLVFPIYNIYSNKAFVRRAL